MSEVPLYQRLNVRPQASKARTSPPTSEVGATALALLLYRADVSWEYIIGTQPYLAS
jgi:hypothetical protein